MIDASLPHIYGPNDWDNVRERVLQKRGIATIAYEMLICSPRRFGKTTSVSMFCAVMLVHAPECWISVFSTGQRASTLLLDQTAKFVKMLPGALQRIQKHNQENLFLKGTAPSDQRRLFSFPSSVGGLKGVGARIIVLEEASRLDEAVFSEVIVPLLGVSNTSLIGISTPLEAGNFYSQMLQMKRPDGQLLFKVLSIEMICALCKEAGVFDCTHINRNPPWKSSERAELVKQLMSNDQAMWQREQLGIVTSSDTSAFDQAGIDRFALHHVLLANTNPEGNDVYVSFDPCGGGASGAAISFGFTDTVSKCFVVCGVDTKQLLSDGAQEQFLTENMQRLRSLPNMANVRLICIIESNFGGNVGASRIANILGQFPPVRIMTGDTTSFKRAGVCTTAAVKERSRFDLQRLLRLDLIRTSEPFASPAPAMREEMIKQLRNFKMEIIQPDMGKDNIPKKAKLRLSGKGYNSNDDLVMSLLLAIFWATVHRGSVTGSGDGDDGENRVLV
jgi:hypothetical protein